ncbi:MAG: KH domain-containing protein [Candidatus Saccharimonadales bacterium]
MSSIDEQFVEFVVKSLVNNPDKVNVERRIDEKGVLLELTVDPEDLGRVIGKRGATAQSIRTLLRALGTKNDARYNLKIVDNGIQGPRSSSSDDNSYSSSDDQTTKGSDDEIKIESEEGNVNEADEGVTEGDSQDATSDRISKARKELEELDDLDV